MATKKLKVLMASAEVDPFAKAGGMADVVGSLPPALKKQGTDIRVIMPKYGFIDEKYFDKLSTGKCKLKKIHENIEIPSGGKFVKINIWETSLPGKGVKVYLIENKKYLGGKDIYVNGDNAKRFLFFSIAALYSLPALKFSPDIVHCHDYHTGLIPLLIEKSDFTYFKNIKTVYTIHNLNYQGKTEFKTLEIANLKKKDLKLAPNKKTGKVNFMAEGIISADIINTVSPTYSKEIMTKEYGAGLEGLLRKHKKKLTGVVNGIDVDFFNPMKDKFIKKKFGVKSLGGKTKNKLLLQKELGLPQDENTPIIGLVSRLVYQKGLELITDDMMKMDAQFVFLGTGQDKYEKLLQDLEKKYPQKVRALIKFDISLAQRIYASSDMFLMPSRYEPCGLGQMIAMRYATVPVARLTGGLADTVDAKVGFTFRSSTARSLNISLKKAIKTYSSKKWQRIQMNCMNKDFSWNKSAKEYLRLYKKSLKV